MTYSADGGHAPYTHVVLPRTDNSETDQKVREIAARYADPDTARFAINDYRDYLADQQETLALDSTTATIIVESLRFKLADKEAALQGARRFAAWDECDGCRSHDRAYVHELEEQIARLRTVISSVRIAAGPAPRPERRSHQRCTLDVTVEGL